MSSSKQQAVPAEFRDELSTSTQVRSALGFLKSPPEAWIAALAEYRRVAWAYQTTFSRHMAGDVTMQRQHVEELAARVGRVMPGAATQDLQISLEAAREHLAGLEALLASNPDEPSRIERAAQRASNARRLQDL